MTTTQRRSPRPRSHRVAATLVAVALVAAVASCGIVIVPPNTPHKFTNDGPERSKLVCGHASPTFVTDWLE